LLSRLSEKQLTSLQTTIGGNEGENDPKNNNILKQHYGGDSGDAVGYVTY